MEEFEEVNQSDPASRTRIKRWYTSVYTFFNSTPRIFEEKLAKTRAFGFHSETVLLDKLPKI